MIGAIDIMAAKTVNAIGGDQRIDNMPVTIIGKHMQRLALVGASLHQMGDIGGDMGHAACGTDFGF